MDRLTAILQAAEQEQLRIQRMTPAERAAHFKMLEKAAEEREAILKQLRTMGVQ